ncbi:MAG: ATP-binding cassette domain-containing protein [Pseudomonadota bacterium]|nr:ATP-binding cassette domain-containing protein [Pseudomonadota bacterium]
MIARMHTPSSSPATLSVQALAFGYRRQPLFDALDAHIGQPGIYGLFGRNGSGKSTLLKLLAGLLTPAGGHVTVGGHTPRARAADFLASIYLLPEEFHLPNLTPAQLARSHGGFYPRFSRALFDAYLAELQVPVAQRFDGMSLGQKKKATIAFALATLTPVLLMDEPTNGLDIVSRTQFRQLMARPEHAARTVLISTHQAHDLQSVLGHVWFIDQGQLLLSVSMARLAERLSMGVALSEQALPGADRLIHQEPVGDQWAWVARRADAQEGAHLLQLELLYKALSLNQDAVLAALDGLPTEGRA